MDERALEVAAKRSYEYEGDRKRISYVGWDNEPGEVRAEWRESVRQALEPYLQAAGSADGWQDIASAPKDGAYVLVFRPDEGDEKHYAHIDTDTWRGSSWFHSRRNQQPTHWRPLPAPPSAMLAAGGVK